KNKNCVCLPHQISQYYRKLSGPIIDRIDIYVDVDDVAHKKLLSNEVQENSQSIAKRVKAAREKQLNRFGSSYKTNADMSNQEVKRLANLTASAQKLLNQAAEQLQISARNYMRCVKTARTIADLENSQTIESQHMSEALQY